MNTKRIIALSALALAILAGIYIYPFLSPEGMYYPYPSPIKVTQYSEDFIKEKGISKQQLERIALKEFNDALWSPAREELNLREKHITLDPNPWPKLIKLHRFETYDCRNVLDGWKWFPAMNIEGKSVEEVIRLYAEEGRSPYHHNIDTLRYGESINKNLKHLEVNYIVSKIHHAEIHIVVWYWETNGHSYVSRVFFIKNGQETKAFYGYQMFEEYQDRAYRIIIGTNNENFTI